MDKAPRIRHMKLEMTAKLYSQIRNKANSIGVKPSQYILECVTRDMEKPGIQQLARFGKEAYLAGDMETANRLSREMNILIIKNKILRGEV